MPNDWYIPPQPDGKRPAGGGLYGAVIDFNMALGKIIIILITVLGAGLVLALIFLTLWGLML